jgi:hypothetical protein
LVAAALLGVAASAPAVDGAPTWLDADGRILPFRSDEEVLDFLRNAPVIGYKQLTGGSNDPFRLELELPGYRVRAIFRNVDVTRRSSSSAAERLFPSFRDSYAFEVAAYEMSRLLGLDNVPPAILYEWRGERGSLQLWVEEAHTEGERIEAGETPADPAAWHLQRTSMLVFDNLIYNFDRNHGNQLIDARGKLWFIDHTRSFKASPTLPSGESIVVVDADLWRHLRALDRATIEASLGPYLDLPQMDALLRRHQRLLRHVERLIAERGEDQVLLSGLKAPAPTPGG